MKPLRLSFATSSIMAALALLACHTEEPKSPSVGLTKPVDPPEMPVERGPPTVEIDGPYSMYVTESISSQCSGPDPFFSFDASQPTAGDEPTMKNLVTCMSSGPLRGRTIRLIGHTDPRGTAEHNDKLGLDRAEKVKGFLVSHGIDKARVETASTGAAYASPEPTKWGKDRRVEVELVK